MGSTRIGQFIRTQVYTTAAGVNQYRFVVRRGTGTTIEQAGASTVRTLGVAMQDQSAVGEEVTVAVGGDIVPVISGGAINLGSRVASGADGKAVAITDNPTNTAGFTEAARARGGAVTAVTAADKIVSVMLD